jgi:hypothetical protein
MIHFCLLTSPLILIPLSKGEERENYERGLVSCYKSKYYLQRIIAAWEKCCCVFINCRNGIELWGGIKLQALVMWQVICAVIYNTEL